jgi:hypothetical protein
MYIDYDYQYDKTKFMSSFNVSKTDRHILYCDPSDINIDKYLLNKEFVYNGNNKEFVNNGNNKVTAYIDNNMELGEQLFIIFSTIYFSYQYGYEYEFVRDISVDSNNSPWGTILSSIKTVNKSSFNSSIDIFYEKDHNIYDPIIPIGNNMMLFGDFQSHKYFDNMYDKIYQIIMCNVKGEDLTLLNQILEPIISKCRIEQNYTTNKCFESLHFIHFTNNQNNQSYGIYKNKKKVLLSEEYYFSLINEIEKKNVYYLVITDDTDKSKTIFKEYNNFFYYDLKNYSEHIFLLLMSFSCGGVISNSALSWWGAYLQGSRRISAPKFWYDDYFDQSKHKLLEKWLISSNKN